MQLSPLQLEGYFLKGLRFSLNDRLESMPSRSTAYDNIGIKVNAEATTRDNDPLKWRCELTVESNEDPKLNRPYTFCITFVGFFHVVKGYPSERVELLARTNAPALLFSAAREALVLLTSRGPYPAIVLPSVTFLEPRSPSSDEREQAGGDGKKKIAKKLPLKKGARKLAEKQ